MEFIFDIHARSFFVSQNSHPFLFESVLILKEPSKFSNVSNRRAQRVDRWIIVILNPYQECPILPFDLKLSYSRWSINDLTAVALSNCAARDKR